MAAIEVTNNLKQLLLMPNNVTVKMYQLASGNLLSHYFIRWVLTQGLKTVEGGGCSAVHLHPPKNGIVICTIKMAAEKAKKQTSRKRGLKSLFRV